MLHAMKRVVMLALLLDCAEAWAWGAVGHMTVGTIADRLLQGTRAGTEARKILQSNLRTAAVWADCAKGVKDATLKYEGRGKYPECAVYENDASEAQMVAYVKRNLKDCKPHEGAEVCHKQYHYTDVAVQRDHYSRDYAGTSDNDIVFSINAAIAVLKGQSPPAPFRIVGRREALRLLAHYVGDVHQPLHVGAVYLDPNGGVIDPDKGAFDPATETTGGNDLLLPTGKLHSAWDGVPDALSADQLLPAALGEARAVAKTAGAVEKWSALWATESLLEAQGAYKGLTYSGEDAGHRYKVTTPAGYQALREQVQRRQIIKAGARLAQILSDIWP